MNSISTVLREGSQGAEVTKLQENLQKLGFYSSQIDGQFGPRTKQAVIAFQKSQQLTADGIVGERTWAKLKEALQVNNPRFNFQVVTVQDFIASHQIQATNPKAVASQLFRGTEEEDGRGFDEVSITYTAQDQAVILRTIIGLAEDSVSGVRFRVELKRNQNRWEIIWVGRQFRCQPGRGQQDWAATLCL
jgi:hypothetical protein